MVAANLLYPVYEKSQKADLELRQSYRFKDERADLSTISHNSDQIHIHGGIDRMTGLISMVEDANESGHSLPLVVMRNKSNQTLALHTHAQVRPLLDTVRRRKNVIESAHNRVVEKYQDIASAGLDKSLSVADRLAKAEEALTFALNYETHLDAEIAAYDPDALPADLGTLKAVYIERLEAAARKREAHFQGVLTQQGAILPPSCDEEEAAGRKVAMALRLGSIRINSADDAAGAKSAYEAGLSAIAEIHPLNIPEFMVDGKPYKSSSKSKAITLSSQSLTVFADHPQRGRLTDLTLRVRFFGADQAPLRLQVDRYRQQPGETRKGFTAVLSAHAGATVQVEIVARNACGPAEGRFSVSVPN